MIKKKLIIFDVDNTLVKLKSPFTYVWEIFNNHFEVSNEDYELYKKWKNSEIRYPTWIQQDLELYKAQGANKRILEKLVMENTSVEEGTSQFIRELKKNNYLGIVSGSVDTMLKIHDLSSFWDKVYLNRINYDNMGEILTEATYHTDYDGEKKINGVLEMCYYFNIPLSACVYIGDGDNDIPVVTFLNDNGGTSISFNGSNELNRVANHVHNGSFIKLENTLL